MIKQSLRKGHILVCLILVSCTDTSVTPNFPKDLGLNGSYQYYNIESFAELEGEKIGQEDTLRPFFEENLLGFSSANWFTLSDYSSFRDFKVTDNEVIWKEIASPFEIVLAKRTMSVGDTWSSKLTWENEKTVVYTYEVVDFFKRYTLNSIDYHNVFVLEEKLSSENFDTRKWYYWISLRSGIIKTVSPTYYNGTYSPIIFEKIN